MLLFGNNVKDLTEDKTRELVSVVPQKAMLFAGTIADNLRFGKPDATRDEMITALERAQATDVADAKGGLEGLIEQGARNLSGGQRQRLTIARALIAQKPILILDDSSSALDMATDKRLREALRQLGGQITIFIVSQRTGAISDADNILVLDNGRLVAQGKHEELVDACETYKEIFISQQK